MSDLLSAPASAPEPTGSTGDPGSFGSPGIIESTVSQPGNEPWYGVLPPERADRQPFLSQFKSREAFEDAFKETKAALSKKLEGYIKLPGDSASPEDHDAFRKALGVPETADQYEVTAEEVNSLPGFDPESLNPWKETAHSLGLSKDQFNGLVATQAKLDAQVVAQTEQAERALANEWGDDFEFRVGDIESRVGDVLDLSHTMLPRVDVLRALDLLTADYRPDSTTVGGKSSASVSLQEQIQTILADPKYRSGDSAIREKLHSLYREEAAREAATRR